MKKITVEIDHNLFCNWIRKNEGNHRFPIEEEQVNLTVQEFVYRAMREIRNDLQGETK